MWSKSVETLNPYNALTGEKKKEPQTNADRIRAMNDEELARFFSETFCNGYGKPQLAEWLRSPAEKEGE